MHLWNPSPAVVYSSRPPLRESDAGQAAGAAAKPAAGGGAGRLGLGGMRATPSDETGSSDSSGREWHRNELVRLMEAAVATPDEWAAVAKQVWADACEVTGRGRSPSVGSVVALKGLGVCGVCPHYARSCGGTVRVVGRRIFLFLLVASCAVSFFFPYM